MTGYHITLGYNGAVRNPIGGYDEMDEMWEELKRVVNDIRCHPQRIIDEARRLESPEESEDGTTLDDMKYAYTIMENQGNPVEIIERGDDRQIMQLASTGSPMKYHVRRAFVRLVMEEMHKRSIEICVNVC